jgi:multiple sugar transport system substrate-binding protein
MVIKETQDSPVRENTRPSWRTGLMAVLIGAVLLVGCGGESDEGDESDESDESADEVSDAPEESAGEDTTGDGESVEIEFWGWVPGLEDAVVAWNEDNPEIQVTFHRMTGDDGAKIPSAIDAGTAPDVFQLGGSGVPEQVIAGRLTDIRPYVEELELADAYNDTAWSAVTFGEAIYGFPQDDAPSGMLYRADLFEEHGVEVPTTWEEYLEAGRELKAADPDLYLAQFSPNEVGFWMQQVWQAGGSFYGIEGDSWTVTVNDEHSMEVAELWQTALDEELFKVVEMWTPEYWTEINAGHIATINYMAWFPALLNENAADLSGAWSVTNSPRIGGEDTAGSGGFGVNAVAASSEHPAEAVEFAAWLNTSDEGLQFLIEDGGIFPAAIAGADSEALYTPSEYFGGEVINELFIEEQAKVPSSWTTGPTHNLTQEALKDAFAQVANGELTMMEALDLVAEQERRDLEDAGLSVE